jgi:glycosyltransferase involved in cell wall biosynthesis
VKILFCWTDISGYMAACWQTLAARSGVDLTVLANDVSTAPAFDPSLMHGMHWIRLSRGDRTDATAIQSHVGRLDPDVIVIAGWLSPAYRRMAYHVAAGEGGRTRLILATDTPWRGTVRQQVARLVLRRYCGQFDAAWVPGERGRHYARRLGFPRDRVLQGLYGFDWDGASRAWDIRQRVRSRPRRFLFIGRYVRDKGIDLLLNGYARYREAVADPWDLACCGQGPLGNLLAGRPGVIDRGFRQPDQLVPEIAAASALVAPSRYDPWNVAIMEAAAGGLPILCSHACGVSAEVVREGITGHAFEAKSVEAVTHAMLQAHHAPHLHALGSAAREAVRPYAADAWADRLLAFVNNLPDRREYTADKTGFRDDQNACSPG